MFKSGDVLKLADRFMSPSHADSFDKQSALINCLVLVAIFHIVMSIAFAKMEEWERKHNHHVSKTVEIVFTDLMVAPPEFHKKKEEDYLAAQSLINLKNSNTGSQSGAKKGTNVKAAIIKSEEKIISNVAKVQIANGDEKKVEQKPIDKNGQLLASRAIDDEQKQAAISQNAIANPAIDASDLGDPNAISDSNFKDGDGLSNGISGDYNGNPGDSNLAPGAEIPQPTASSVIQLKDIAPYRKEMLMRIAREWTPPKNHQVTLVVLMTIAKDGTLLKAQIIGADASKRVQKDVLEAIERTIYAPLPDWYKKDQLSFKIELRNYQ